MPDPQLLVAILLTLCPAHDCSPEHVLQSATAAVEASEKVGVPVELLLAIGIVESRYDPRSLSRLECTGKTCERVTGTWPSDEQPKNTRAPWYCGVTQVGGHVPWETCVELMHDTPKNYAVGAEHLIEWRNDPMCRYRPEEERMVCALRGYNGGYAAIERGTSSYPNVVLRYARYIRRKIDNASNS